MLTPSQKAWEALSIDADLGMDCDDYKWQQNQSYVEIFVKLPAQPLASLHHICILSHCDILMMTLQNEPGLACLGTLCHGKGKGNELLPRVQKPFWLKRLAY